MTQSSGLGMPKKLSTENLDLMKPGFGTPWEDRGSSGAIVAYFKTVYRSMIAPSLLMDHISRPESTTDSRLFAYISCAMWGVGVLGANAYVLYDAKQNHSDWEVNYPLVALTAVVEAVLLSGAIFLWFKVGTKVFRALGATELQRVSPSLIENCMAYSLGPSLLAVIPILGWAVAFVWIVVDQVMAGRRRLYMKLSSAVPNPIFPAIGAAVLVTVLFFGFPWLWGTHFHLDGYDRQGLYNPDALYAPPVADPNAVNVLPGQAPAPNP